MLSEALGAEITEETLVVTVACVNRLAGRTTRDAGQLAGMPVNMHRSGTIMVEAVDYGGDRHRRRRARHAGAPAVAWVAPCGEYNGDPTVG